MSNEDYDNFVAALAHFIEDELMEHSTPQEYTDQTNDRSWRLAKDYGPALWAAIERAVR